MATLVAVFVASYHGAATHSTARLQIKKRIAMLLHQPIDYHAARRPHAPALAAADYQWDYKTLVERSHAIAQTLLDMGVQEGERVGVLGLNSAAHLAV